MKSIEIKMNHHQNVITIDQDNKKHKFPWSLLLMVVAGTTAGVLVILLLLWFIDIVFNL
jgi:hypothetical protein